MSKSNLLKGSCIKENGQRIIDFNDVISNRIEELKKQAEEGNVNAGFVSGLNAHIVENLIGNEEEQPSEHEGVEPLLTGAPSQENQQEYNELAEQTLREAEKRADAIVAEARNQANGMLAAYEKQGYDKGYADGFNKGYSEGHQKAQSEFSAKTEALEQERLELNEKFRADYSSIEPEIVNTVLDVMEKITGVVYENNRDIIIHLINRVLDEVDASSEYLIRVSHEDYEFVLGKQARLYSASSKEMNIDIIEDRNLSAGQCVIETDGGIFDCSLDVQMEQLVNDIRLLSSM